MNFQTIPPVGNSKQMLDFAFKKAREKGVSINLKGNWLQVIRKKESLKLDLIKDVIVSRLKKILSDFPTTSGLPNFYLKLMYLTLDFTLFKQSLGAANWAVGKIGFLQRGYVSKINRTTDREIIRDLSKQFYGRISSVLKQIDDNLGYLEESRRIMRTYPDVKEMFTVCIYGFPNVGKTTLLNKLTGSKAKVADYAFTTTGINAGYFCKVSGKNIQVLDVPGTLNRKDNQNKVELQAELVVKELANIIIYIFDLSEYSGYSIKDQEQLFQSLKVDKPVLIYLSKMDLVAPEVLAKFKHKYYSVEEIKEKINSLF